ncbi:MAG: Gp15 family bacteriophage protein [Clostridia bacterium]
MNKSFSLSRKLEEVLPGSIKSDEEIYAIHADFRNILLILRLLEDPDVADCDKLVLACHRFYTEAMPPNAFEAMMQWIVPEKQKRDPCAPPMDFEFDADVIYASFRAKYGMDLLHIDFLHWREFYTLLNGLDGDTALGARLTARGRDTSKLKGKEKQSAEIAKQNAQIPAKLGEDEMQLRKALIDALMNGGDVSGVGMQG